MLKSTVLIVILALVTGSAFAQGARTIPKKKARKRVGFGGITARPHPNEPTTVAGDPIMTPDGLRYWDLEVGTGETARNGHIVKIHYTGWLPDGRKFDSSVDRGEPFSFKLGAGNVLRGWDEGVAGMQVGGRRQLRVPLQLANGWARILPPDSMLTFDVELLGVQ